jgi:DNA polymerase I
VSTTDQADTIPFREVWTIDTEYQAGSGDRPFVVCLCARELRSGRTLRLWRDDLIRLPAPPFDVGPDALFVAFYAPAELGCVLQLGWPLPTNVLDLYAEHRMTTNGLKLSHPRPNSLLGVLSLHGLARMKDAEKEAGRTLVLGQASWSAAEIEQTLNYCSGDVLQTESLLKRMAGSVDWPRALWRGRYAAAVARIEHIGVPIDAALYEQLAANWPALKARLVAAVNADFGVYDGTIFKEDRFASWLAQQGIPWPRYPTGRLMLDKDTFRERARAYPALVALHELRRTLGLLRLTDLVVGRDARNRCMLSPFATVTGRNAPSNTKFIFGAAKWLRGLIRPPEGHGLAYLDWSAQEFAIAAALSGDERMMADYVAGDPHIGFARTARLVPPDATKVSHPLIREKCKTTNLGVLYGMKAHGLAARLGLAHADAEELLRIHRSIYRKFWSWSEAMVSTALMRREIRTAFGWRMHVTPATKGGTLLNWPMQSHGADMLRGAAIAATEAGIAVAAPIHDAMLIEAPLDRLGADVEAMRAIMEQASVCVSGSLTVRVDAGMVRYPARYCAEDAPTMWTTAMRLLGKCATAPGTGSEKLSELPELPQ